MTAPLKIGPRNTKGSACSAPNGESNETARATRPAPACRAKNPTQDTWFATSTGAALTRAIAAAHEGDRLNVFGRCRGSFSIDKGLRIFGNANRQAPTVLDGNGAAGVVFVNERVTVTLTRLTITGGNATVRVGGGIQTGGLLTLNRVTVTGNRSASDHGQRQRPRRLPLLVTGSCPAWSVARSGALVALCRSLDIRS